MSYDINDFSRLGPPLTPLERDVTFEQRHRTEQERCAHARASSRAKREGRPYSEVLAEELAAIG